MNVTGTVIGYVMLSCLLLALQLTWLRAKLQPLLVSPLIQVAPDFARVYGVWVVWGVYMIALLEIFYASTIAFSWEPTPFVYVLIAFMSGCVVAGTASHYWRLAARHTMVVKGRIRDTSQFVNLLRQYLLQAGEGTEVRITFLDDTSEIVLLDYGRVSRNSRSRRRMHNSTGMGAEKLLETVLQPFELGHDPVGTKIITVQRGTPLIATITSE